MTYRYRIVCTACGTLNNAGRCDCTKMGRRWRPRLLTRKERRKLQCNRVNGELPANEQSRDLK
jgi:hypothetical protein